MSAVDNPLWRVSIIYGVSNVAYGSLEETSCGCSKLPLVGIVGNVSTKA